MLNKNFDYFQSFTKKSCVWEKKSCLYKNGLMYIKITKCLHYIDTHFKNGLGKIKRWDILEKTLYFRTNHRHFINSICFNFPGI